MKPRRPVLRYHGGKWNMAPWLIQQFPPHTTYVEPYCGAASVLLRKPRSRSEIINDMDDEVYNLFCVVRDRGQRLASLLELTPFSRREYMKCIRPAKDPMERARRIVVRSFMGFGSDSFRANRTSGFRARFHGSGLTTPAADWMNYPESLRLVVERLRGVVIEHRPALEILRMYDKPETFFYCDPPYPISTRSACSHGRHCYSHEMTNEDHRILADALHAVRGKVIVSGYLCPLYVSLYRDWRRLDVDTLADGARPRRESIWISPSTQVGLFSDGGAR